MGNKSPIILLLYLSTISLVSCNTSYNEFLMCMAKHQIQENIYTPLTQTYIDLFQLAQQNTRWLNTNSSKPVLIYTPKDESQIQATITCSTLNNLQIRVKSGGHDYEGASFLSQEPYMIMDLVNLRNIDIDLVSETAWVQTGATLGELYYNIAMKSPIHAFSAGTSASVGTGGHISGGGFGMITRKFGLAADNVIDARLIDVKGRILDRKAMGEDLFWAIRGSGGASYGIITAWRIKLVRVPPIVTTFTVYRWSNNGSAIDLVNKWQLMAHRFPKELLMRVFLQQDRKSYNNILAKFNTLFLGTKSELIPLMEKEFSELGLKESDCYEMPWINTTVFSNKNMNPLEILLNRTDPYKTNYKGKTDFVIKPILIGGLHGLFDCLARNPDLLIILDPFGGRLDEISETELPFPHRKGTLYNIQYLEKWNVNNVTEAKKHLEMLNEVYHYMEPYVSKNPRLGYINYKDFDLGVNNAFGKTSFDDAKVWGESYFKGNFERLAKVKSQVDPQNFFRNEQSIPPFDA